jgi:hypothetical protein
MIIIITLYHETIYYDVCTGYSDTNLLRVTGQLLVSAGIFVDDV